MEINKIYINETDYPRLLREIPHPPEVLYYCGNLDLTRKKCVAVVGSRRATEYGRRTARRLAEILSHRGASVVSGMALGIDSCAHSGALEAGEKGGNGGTIAVLGCGPDVCYPASAKKLRDSIGKKGLILSEYPPGTPPAKFRFPQRNRIISGLSEITVVVQAPVSSGALITAETAAEQGRTIYAVPANIDSLYSLGSNKLLQDGALPLVVLEDLLDDLKLGRAVSDEAKASLGKEEAALVELLSREGEMTIEQLCRATGRPVGVISGIVTILEIKGVICTALGKIFIAK